MNFYRLEGTQSSLVIAADKGMPEVVYWGAKLGPLTEEELSHAMGQVVAQASLDQVVPLGLSPESAQGWFAKPGLSGHHQGQHAYPLFDLVELEHSQQSLSFKLIDKHAELAIDLYLKLDKSDVLEHHACLTNLAEQAYSLESLCLSLPLPRHASELQTYHGRWTQEFQSQRQQLKHGIYSQENRRGRTSHQYFPAMLAGSVGFNEVAGEVYGWHLVWSGNHRMQVAVKSDGRRYLQSEELLLPGEIQLAEQQSYTTPTLYACYSGQGTNSLAQSFHRYVRQHIISFPDPAKPRPVHLNTWEGIYCDHQPEYIKQMASKAAELGVERFIVDDGWFIGRNGEQAGLGDWFLDQQKYPLGMQDISKHVHELGMEFGLWFEPEMVNPNSELYRQYPDWLLGQAGYAQPSGRYQYALDLQNPEVFAYLLERLVSLVSEYQIDYIKWDMNRELVQAAHLGQAAAHKQTKAFYALVDELSQAHPNLEIESCASGGARIDFEVLKRTQRFWTSDCNDALERQSMQLNMLQFFPPEVMGAHIGPAHCHTTYRQHSIGFRGLSALLGHMGVELDPVKESQQEQQGFADYIALHKQLRPLLHSGQFVRLPHPEDSRQCYGVVAADASEAVFFVAQLRMPNYGLAGSLPLLGLQPQAQYQVELLDTPDCQHLMKQLPAWMSQQAKFSGEFLMKIGLALPVLDPESALLFRVVRCAA